MEFNVIKVDDGNFLIIDSNNLILTDIASALDIISIAGYDYNCSNVVIKENNICKDFFDLKTNIAGEILQKFVNYGLKIAIIGDFSKYSSKSLKDFIYECNSGKNIFFVKDVEEAKSKFKV